ncbi:hypothetical protein GCM10008933_24760 [Paenibacillus motobuensis]|uniref:Uncharacterized protein n=1 Tax=Paenibacillus motobuensis TaxID=295324 RepID=A0ABP3I7H3_9BACL
MREIDSSAALSFCLLTANMLIKLVVIALIDRLVELNYKEEVSYPERRGEK